MRTRFKGLSPQPSQDGPPGKVVAADGGKDKYSRRASIVYVDPELQEAEEMMHPKSPPEKLEFNAFFGSLILLNAVCIGVEADLTDAEEDVGTKNLLKVIEVIFLTLFTLELAVRLVYRESLKDFVLDGWNLMDGILVCIGILDLLSAALDLREVTVLRMLRLLKLYRLSHGT